jgi:putative membrane protein
MLSIDNAKMLRDTRAVWWVLLVEAAVGLVWSGIKPFDRPTWALEVFPVVLAVAILWPTRRNFPLTALVYGLIVIHAAILMLGGHYTYAEVPLGHWLREAFDFERNHYDRLGHFAQGFVPAIVAREILLRRTPLLRGGWLFFIVCAICLAVSACYEFLEWWTALIGGGSAEAFLGTQGDVWDTQWDMFLATCGAILAQLTLSRWHDRQLAQ